MPASLEQDEGDQATFEDDVGEAQATENEAKEKTNESKGNAEHANTIAGDASKNESQAAEPEDDEIESPELIVKTPKLAELTEKIVNHPPVKIIEAALFLGNRFLTFKELGDMAGVKEGEARAWVAQIQKRFSEGNAAIEVNVTEDGAVMQVKPELVGSVAQLSKRIELSRKATRILALIAKKGNLMQSDLKNYFRGEIYLYTTELKELGYIESKKHGNTRVLKPTQKFYDNFQLSQ